LDNQQNKEMMPMIKVIAGEKGTGKTAQLVDDINEQARTDNNNIVCIERGNRLDRLLMYKIRLIDIDEYPVEGYDQLLSFLGEICAKDYDLTHVYIDSIIKVTKNDNMDDFASFLAALDKFLEKTKIDVTIICSGSGLPEGITKYC